MFRTTMTWDSNSLDYGYVVERLPDGEWWHMHFGRAAVEYDCELLGRRSNVFAQVQHFRAGVVAKSPLYLLTLDGEGIDCPTSELGLDFRWSGIVGAPDLAEEARRFQLEVMPLLRESEAMQRAVMTIIQSRRYLHLVALGKLRF